MERGIESKTNGGDVDEILGHDDTDIRCAGLARIRLQLQTAFFVAPAV
jgi:hypothetical protein